MCLPQKSASQQMLSEMYGSLYASTWRPGFAAIRPASVCAFCLCGSVFACFMSVDSPAFYESSFSSRLSVLAIFRGGAEFSPSVGSCSRFFAAFWGVKRRTITFNKLLTAIQKISSTTLLYSSLNCYLFIPLLMKISQQDVCLLCNYDCSETRIEKIIIITEWN